MKHVTPFRALNIIKYALNILYISMYINVSNIIFYTKELVLFIRGDGMMAFMLVEKPLVLERSSVCSWKITRKALNVLLLLALL